MVINLDVPWQVILKRIEERWIHEPSGRTYNLSFNPPKKAGLDDITQETLTKRSDDHLPSFKVRLEEYEKVTVPLLEYYQSRNVLYDFKGRISDDITPDLIRLLERKFGI